MNFDETYYTTIWPNQGVHRHDYCPDLARSLVAKYGTVRILDIGTGCGYLVKCLRELGADAWGLELSEYALAHSCDPSHVRLGDVRDIPFAAKRFDIVFSQGLWCHVPETDIQAAWSECQRVGTTQDHNIDYEEAPQDIPYFVTRRSEQWWKNQFYPRVLVACPTHEVKEYAFAQWIDCVKRLDYPNYDVLVVDNSPTTDFFNRWKHQIPMVHLPDMDQSENASARINASMQVIQQHFLAGDYTWWFNLEADVIVAPEALKTLLQYPSDWTSHGYQLRGGGGLMQGIGCSLLSRSIAEAGRFTSNVHGPDAVLWEQTMHTHKTIALTQMFAIQHLGKADGHGG